MAWGKVRLLCEFASDVFHLNAASYYRQEKVIKPLTDRELAGWRRDRDLKVSKSVTKDGEVTTDTMDAPESRPCGNGGRGTMVAMPGQRRCDIRCAYMKGHMGCMKWVL